MCNIRQNFLRTVVLARPLSGVEMTRIANATTEGKASGSPLGKRRSNNVLDNMGQSVLAIAYCGAVAPEAFAAHQAVAEDIPGAGLLAITSPDRLHRDWRAARARGEIGMAERPLARVRPLSPSATSTRRDLVVARRCHRQHDRPTRRRPLWPIRRHP